MFWLPVTIATFIFCVCYNIFIDKLEFDDYLGFTFFGFIAGMILTLFISLFLFHSAPSVYIYENDYDLVPIAEGVYGMPSKSNSNYIECYTEDDRDALRQFTIMSEGYHIEPLRGGGVPIRDYHLSDMPYAFGTYVKESSEQYTYKNGKANTNNYRYYMR